MPRHRAGVQNKKRAIRESPLQGWHDKARRAVVWWIFKERCYLYYKGTTRLVTRSLRRLPQAAAPWFAPLGKPRLRKLRLRFAPLRMTRKTFVPPYFYSMYLGGVFGVVVPKNLRELMLRTAQKSHKFSFDSLL